MCNLPESHVRQILEENQVLRKRVDELEKRLRLYESPHIPSSKRIIKEPEEPREPMKRGAPEGHMGATRKKPRPNRIIELKPERCPNCRSKDVDVLHNRTKTVEDIKIIKIVTEFKFSDCICNRCRTKFTTGDEEFPKQGNFGPNILSLWTNLHYQGTIPFDRLAAISGNLFGMPITEGGLHNVIYRTAGILQPYFDGISKRVMKSKYARSDETSYSFNGKNWWMWNISTMEDTLVLLRPSRSSEVLKEALGKFFDGVLNSDCFRAYDKYKAREYQKCWAHVLRDAKDLAKHNTEGKELHKKLQRMFAYIKKAKKEEVENFPKVKRWVKKQKEDILSWLENNYESKAVKNLVLRMSKYSDQWFTCLKYRFVEPTNNASERDIRKGVIARKISGQHRSLLGAHSREIMMSTLLTLEKREINPFEFIDGEIRKYNLNHEGAK